MLDEYTLVPDVFDAAAYSNPALIEVCLPHLKEPLLQEALVRDLCDGGWSRYCRESADNLHRLCKEILRKLDSANRLRRYPRVGNSAPANAADWCKEGLRLNALEAGTGIIAGHATKQSFTEAEVASIERLTSSLWWQQRSPSVTVSRNTPSYLSRLRRVLLQANSLMFIDPNLDPSQHNYREFHQLFGPLTQRPVKPRIEIHRSFCKGDGPSRSFPTEAQWREAFERLGTALDRMGLSAEVYLWEDFHERYLIADVVGATIPAGFDVTGDPNEWSTWGRLGRDDKDKIQRIFDPAARSNALKIRFRIGIP
jgi:hypothetical protein